MWKYRFVDMEAWIFHPLNSRLPFFPFSFGDRQDSILIPPHPYRNSRGSTPSRRREAGDQERLVKFDPSQTSFRASPKPNRPPIRTPPISREIQEKVEHQTALLHSLGYEAWKLTPPRLRCVSCQRTLRLSTLDRCDRCQRQYSIIELIHMRAKAPAEAYEPLVKPREYCRVCGKRKKHRSRRAKKKINLWHQQGFNLNCLVFRDGKTLNLVACSPDCKVWADNQMEKITSCLEADQRELNNLNQVWRLMKQGLRDRLKPASTSRAAESQQPGTSPNS